MERRKDCLTLAGELNKLLPRELPPSNYCNCSYPTVNAKCLAMAHPPYHTPHDFTRS